MSRRWIVSAVVAAALAFVVTAGVTRVVQKSVESPAQRQSGVTVIAEPTAEVEITRPKLDGALPELARTPEPTRTPRPAATEGAAGTTGAATTGPATGGGTTGGGTTGAGTTGDGGTTGGGTTGGTGPAIPRPTVVGPTDGTFSTTGD